MASLWLWLLFVQVSSVFGVGPQNRLLRVERECGHSGCVQSSFSLTDDGARRDLGDALMRSVTLASQSDLGQLVQHVFPEEMLERGLDCKFVTMSMCCSLTPQKIRVRNGDICRCEGPGPLQDEITIGRACVDFLKSCNEVTVDNCCSRNPKMAWMSNGKHCWCERPFDVPVDVPGFDGTFDQFAIDKSCSARQGSCLELSEAHCCHSSPMRQLVRLPKYNSSELIQIGECKCKSAGSLEEQAQFDKTCGRLIRNCSEMPEEQCCRQSPARYMMEHQGKCWCSGPFVFNGKKYEQHQLDAYCHDFEKSLRRPCSDLSQEDCCKMFPKRIHTVLQEGMCSCEMPVDTVQVDALCGKVKHWTSCDDHGAAECCGMSPRNLLTQGNEEGRCLCSGNSLTVSQNDIDKHCNSILWNCTDLSPRYCCEKNKIPHAGPHGSCFCTGACEDVTHQDIENFCTENLKSCAEVTAKSCCAQSPKKLHVSNGDGTCGCLDAVAGQSQSYIDSFCQNLSKPCPTLSDAECCSLAPKRMRMTDYEGNCWCAAPREVSGVQYNQLHIDKLCQNIVKPCDEMTAEYCCSFSPARVKSDAATDGMCSCFGPSVLYDQVAIDAACSNHLHSCSEVTELSCCGKTPLPQVRLTNFADSCWCTGPLQLQETYFSQSMLNASCERLVKPCSNMTNQHCCSMSPARIRRDINGTCMCEGPTEKFDQTKINEFCKHFLEVQCTQTGQAQCCSMEPKLQFVAEEISGRSRCFCLPATQNHSQTAIEDKCKEVVKDCGVVSDEVCCTKSPPELRVQSSSGCWCSGPFVLADANVSGLSGYSQTDINNYCRKHLDSCGELLEAGCCSMSPKQLMTRRPFFLSNASNSSNTSNSSNDSKYSNYSDDMCTCSGPSNTTTQDLIDLNCSKTLQSCLELLPSECCAMSPKKARFSNGKACLCAGPPTGTNQSYIDDYCRLTVMRCEDMPLDHCCSSTPMMQRVVEGNGMCHCSAPTSNFSQELIDASCLEAMRKPCQEMSESFCCSFSMPMLRAAVPNMPGLCMCQPADDQISQAQINSTCREDLRPCIFTNYSASLQLESHAMTCCSMSPKKIRMSSQRGLCWCNGPYDNAAMRISFNQTHIDKYCEEVEEALKFIRRPCDELSSAYCCQLSPRRVRIASGNGLCSCVEAVSASDQKAIDANCSETVKDCAELPDSACCERNPPEMRVRGNDGKCWCSGPFSVDDGSYINRDTVTAYCYHDNKPCGPVTNAVCCSFYPKQTSVSLPNGRCACSGPSTKYNITQTSIEATCASQVQACHGLSPASCCSYTPKRARMGNGNLCTCTGPVNMSGAIYDQNFLDAHCAQTVKQCSEMPVDHCCMAWPKMKRTEDVHPLTTCYCSGPTEAFDQVAIDESCDHIPAVPCIAMSISHCCEMYSKKVRVELADGKCQCKSARELGRSDAEVQEECHKILSPCSFSNVSKTARYESHDLQCCSMSPKRMRMQNSQKHCWCNGPLVSHGTNITQSVIDAWCDNMSGILSQRKRPCKEVSEGECCTKSPKQILLKNISGMCWCSPAEVDGQGIGYNQSTIDQICDQAVKPCDEISEGQCCSMRPKRMWAQDGQRCFCSGPNKTTNQKAINAKCDKIVKSCQRLTMADCCRDHSPSQALMTGKDGRCWCSGPVKVNGVLHVQEWIDVQCEIALAT